MELERFLSSSGLKWVLNLLSANYIGRLETKIELLEGKIELLKDDNKRKEEVYGEAMKVFYTRKEYLAEKEEKMERMEKEFKEKEQQINELAQSLKGQKDEILKNIVGVMKRYFIEVEKFHTLEQKNKAKIKELKGKMDVDSLGRLIILEGETHNAYTDLGREAMKTIWEILEQLIKK